ncbi:DUF4405 domain-containing protein [Candidatus Bathyarchaeota archaeon]|nr:DUF4405 domain-containing protein [Candidatus Bathyarchaeota archaeon]
MKRVTLNALINIFTLAFFVTSATSGIILWLFLSFEDRPFQDYFRIYDEGAGPEHDFFGVPRRAWTDLHICSGLIFIMLVVSHDALHWRWYRNLPRILARRDRQQSVIEGLLSRSSPKPSGYSYSLQWRRGRHDCSEDC